MNHQPTHSPKSVEEFTAWMTRCGLSSSTAGAVLGLSRATIKRLRADGNVKTVVAKAMEAYEARSQTTIGRPGRTLDEDAAQWEFHLVTSGIDQCYVTGMTSAIARGWSTGSYNSRRWIGMAPYRYNPTEVAGQEIVKVNTYGLPWGIEVRTDADGNTYRIASPERTLLDLTIAEAEAGEYEVDEAWQGAASEAKTHGRPIDVAWILERVLQHDSKLHPENRKTYAKIVRYAKKHGLSTAYLTT